MSIKIQPILSVIIPTKNRYSTLNPVISTLSKYIKDSDVEFIIQDNSDQNEEISSVLQQLNDERIKYFYFNRSISIVENTVKGIENAKGRYLIFIGDDDLISPDIVNYVRILDKKSIHCLIYNPAYYWWNTVTFANENYFYRSSAFWKLKNPSTEFIELDSAKELNKMLNSGASLYSKLPKLYHGILRREVLDKIKNITGTYLPGSSPDIAFSTAISLVIDKYYFVNLSLSVFGASKNSGGGWTANKKHFGRIEEQDHLPKETRLNWNKYIPKIWSEKSIYGQTVIEVITRMDSNKSFNYCAFYGTMLAYESYLIKYILPSLLSYSKLNFLKYPRIIAYFFKKKMGLYYRNLRLWTRQSEFEVIILNDIEQVMQRLKD